MAENITHTQQLNEQYGIPGGMLSKKRKFEEISNQKEFENEISQRVPSKRKKYDNFGINQHEFDHEVHLKNIESEGVEQIQISNNSTQLEMNEANVYYCEICDSYHD